MDLLKRSTVVNMDDIKNALIDWRDDLQWMGNLYKDILYLLKEEPTTRTSVFVGDGKYKFVSVIDDVKLTLLLINDLGWEPDDLDSDVVKEVLTIHSLLTGDAIPEDCFIVTSDFMLIYEVLTGGFPDDGSTSTCKTGDSV